MLFDWGYSMGWIWDYARHRKRQVMLCRSEVRLIFQAGCCGGHWTGAGLSFPLAQWSQSLKGPWQPTPQRWAGQPLNTCNTSWHWLGFSGVILGCKITLLRLLCSSRLLPVHCRWLGDGWGIHMPKLGCTCTGFQHSHRYTGCLRRFVAPGR